MQQQLASIVSLMRARLVTVGANNDPFYLELLENMQNSVNYPFSPRVAWLSYRIVDEATKRLFLKKMSDSSMPVDLSKLQCVKLKPSPSLLNSLPINHFDTNY